MLGHGRRKCFEVIRKGVEKHENRELLEMIPDLYGVEHEAEREGILRTPAHLELRQRKSKPIVRKIWRWVDARLGEHSPSIGCSLARLQLSSSASVESQATHPP